MKTSKLSLRLLWYITPLVILPLLFLGGFTLSNVTNSTQQQAELVVGRFVEQQQQKILNYINIYQSTTKLLSSSPVLNDFMALSGAESDVYTSRLSALLDVFASYSEAYPDIVSIDLLSPNGESIAYYSSELSELPSEYPFFQRLQNSNVRQQYFISPAGEQTAKLYFVQQIYGIDYQLKRPQRQGYVVLKVDPSLISTSILEAPFDHTLNLIFNQEGLILFSSDANLRGLYLQNDEMTRVQKQSEQTKLAAAVFPSIDEMERMIYSIQLANGYYYISTIPKSLLYESGRIISLITALIIIFSVFALPFLIFVVVRGLLLSPIELLGEASHKVGDGDLEVYLPAHNKDEIGILFTDFNHMVGQIRDTQIELKGFKEHLEEKVETRTRALEEMNQQLALAITQAEQANQLKSRFLANMSHEIRTPLTAIMGFTEQLIQNPSSASNEQYLGTILRNSKHLLELINNILDLSKIEAEKLAVEKTKMNVVALVRDIEAIVAPMASEKLLTFEIFYDLPIPKYLYSDVTRLKQILLNITSNAVKFTEIGGITFTVKFNEISACFEFIVRDTGIGMSSAEIERVFKPFEQADSTTTRRFGGTGLGLCISKNLAQLLGGDVSVYSKQGAGSEFVVTVAGNYENKPYELLAKIEEEQAPLDVNTELSAMKLDAKILLAEDNPDNQMLVKLLLEAWGLTPDIVNNGAEAVEAALVNDYHLILMDMQMPVMGGLEATQMLRHAAYDGPIVALTANVMKQDIDTYLAAGCDATLAKPIDKRLLGEVLVEYLQLQENNESRWDALLQSEKFKQISENYRSKLPEQLELLNQYYLEHEWESLRALAHSLKGSSGCFGFMNIHEAAGQLEQSLKERNAERWHYNHLLLIEAIRYTLSMPAEKLN
ncbi:ATP-binding protein [Pseudoalteromonas xiamenensis]